MRAIVTLVFGIGGFSGCLCAQPTITIEPSPNPGVIIVPVAQAGSPAANALLESVSPNVRPASFFISNTTSQPILSLVVLCTGTVAATGQPRTARVMQEGFQNVQFRPVLDSGARLLFFAPATPVPEARLGFWASSVPGQSAVKSVALWFGGLSSVDISIDSIIFANGEVDGPDREGVVQELGNRKRAADSVLAAIQAGDTAALTAMSVEHVQSGDGHFSEWQKRFAARYLSSPDPSWRTLQLQGLQGYPTPPPLFRGTASDHSN